MGHFVYLTFLDTGLYLLKQFYPHLVKPSDLWRMTIFTSSEISGPCLTRALLVAFHLVLLVHYFTGCLCLVLTCIFRDGVPWSPVGAQGSPSLCKIIKLYILLIICLISLLVALIMLCELSVYATLIEKGF